jgi:hypothetical protein
VVGQREVSTTANVGPYQVPVLPIQRRRIRRKKKKLLTGGIKMELLEKEFHHATVKDKKHFIGDTIRTIALKGVKGIKLTSGKLTKDGKGGPMVAQRYLFHKDNWTEKEAKAWMKDHDKKIVAFEPAGKEVKELVNEAMVSGFDGAWNKVTGGKGDVGKNDSGKVVSSFEGDGWTMKGSFEDTSKQIRSALQEDGGFGEWPQIIGTYSDRIYIESYIAPKDGMETGERKWFEVEYEIDEEGEVTLGDSTELTKRTQFLVKEQAERIVDKLFRISPGDVFSEALTGVNTLPDSSFGYIEKGGEVDDEGKTKPRKLRHYPMKNAKGDWEKGNVVNALVRLRQANKKSSPWMTDAAKGKILAMIKRGYKALELEFPEE